MGPGLDEERVALGHELEWRGTANELPAGTNATITANSHSSCCRLTERKVVPPTVTVPVGAAWCAKVLLELGQRGVATTKDIEALVATIAIPPPDDLGQNDKDQKQKHTNGAGEREDLRSEHAS